VGNFILKVRGLRAGHNDIVLELQEQPLFKRFWGTGHWKLHDQAYEYAGSGAHDLTKMLTIVFTSL
jgi:hypothetical protein